MSRGKGRSGEPRSHADFVFPSEVTLSARAGAAQVRVLPRQTDAGGLNPGRNSHGSGEVPAVKTQDAPSSAAAPRRRPLGDLPRGATPHFPDPPGTACVPDPGAPPSVSHSPRSGGDVGPPKGGRWPQPAWRPRPPSGPSDVLPTPGAGGGGGEGRGGRAMPGRRGVGVTCGRQVPSAEKQARVAGARGCVKEGGGARSPQGRAQIGCPERGTREAAEGNEFAFLKGRNLPFTPRV